MKEALILHIPVIHRGYLELFKKYKNKGLFILGADLVAELSSVKEIRAVPAETTKKFVESLKIFKEVNILEKAGVKTLENTKVTLADDAISHQFAKKYLSGKKVKFENVFLRWDEKAVMVTKPAKGKSSKSISDKEIMARISGEAQKSSDWWRQVGAAIVKNGEILLESHNTHVPSEHMPYIEGDPRDFIAAGKNPEISTVLHAEQGLISEAARQGISLDGSSIYTTTFPCPVCAKLIAYSGIKKCFYSIGSATLDGERILKSHRVEIIQVK